MQRKKRTLLEIHSLSHKLCRAGEQTEKGTASQVSQESESERAEGSQSGPGKGADDHWKSEQHFPEATHQRGPGI